MANIYINCPIREYHYFKVLSGPYMGGGTGETQKEVCRFCGVKKEYAFRLDGEMVDQRAYFLDHIRAFAQPSTEDLAMAEVYYHCNPGMKEKFIKEAVQAKKQEDKNLELTDKYRFAIGRALQDRNDGIKK